MENLDRWGADGIVVLAIDPGDQDPDLQLIERLGALGLSTLLTYGGGLVTETDAREAVRASAERLVLETILSESPQAIGAMASAVGAQALVAAMPMLQVETGEVRHRQHRKWSKSPVSIPLRRLFNSGMISEFLVIDAAGEGEAKGFNKALLQAVEPLSAYQC